MYFDESGYFLDCSTGFISRSKKRLMFVGGDFLYSLERESVKRLLLGSAHLLQERLEGNEAVIVGGVAQLLHQVLGLLLGQLHDVHLPAGDIEP